MAHATVQIGRDRYRTVVVASGHGLVCDEPEKLGGGNAGPAPYDLILAGLGACTAITLRMYADRKQWPLEAVEVALHLGGEGPEAFRIERILTITGLDAAQQARLVEIAERTPVTLTLKGGMAIETRLA